MQASPEAVRLMGLTFSYCTNVFGSYQEKELGHHRTTDPVTDANR